MKKRPTKKPAKNTAPREDAEIARPVKGQLRAPSVPGSPLRVEEFPPLRELARLSCLLANGSLPGSPDAARRLAAAVLEIWRGCRDELTSSKERSESYWESVDESSQRLRESFSSLDAFLSEHNASQLIGAERVSWDEALEVLAYATSKPLAASELKRIVENSLAGQSWWRMWTLKDFKQFGFDSISFPSLILAVDEERARLKAEAKSKEMRAKALLGVKSRRQKKEEDEWASLAKGKKNPTSRKKLT